MNISPFGVQRLHKPGGVLLAIAGSVHGHESHAEVFSRLQHRIERTQHFAAHHADGGKAKFSARCRQREQMIGPRATEAEQSVTAQLPCLLQGQAQLEPLVAGHPGMNQVQPQDRDRHSLCLQHRIMQALQWRAGVWKLDLSHSIFRLPCS